MIKYIRYIFISFLCIILMSHNTFAADISLQARPIWSNLVPSFTCLINGVGVYNNECINLNTDVTVSIRDFTYTIPEGIIVTSATTVMQLELLFDNYADNNSIDGNFLRARFRTGDFGLIDVATSSQGATGYLVRLTFIAERSFTTNANANTNRFTLYNPLNETELAYLKPAERMVITNVGLYNLTGDGTQAIVNAINNNNDTQAINNAKDAIVNAINAQRQAEENYYNEQSEAVDNINNQDTSDINTGDTSGATSIIGVMGTLFTTIKDTAATNCIIAGDLGHVDLGNLNLCQGKEHFLTLFNFMGYSCLFVVVFWAAYHLVKRILALIDWYRGK